jgi:YesN/AraC family two-component response regulator
LELDKPTKDLFRFLIVDDEQVARKLLRGVLETHGYTTIDEADSGPAALGRMGLNEYHVVLLDKNMPGMSGIQVLQAGKTKFPDCEFIMITAYGSMETAIQAMDLGAFSYLTKPFSDVNVIIRRVEAALKNVSLRWENAILLDRLRSTVSQLAILEQEMEASWKESGTKDQQQEQHMNKIRSAVGRLDRLGKMLERLRERAKGSAASVIEVMEKEVSRVAGMLDEE